MQQLFESLNPLYDEDKESKREDSLYDIKRIRESIDEEKQSLLDFQSQLESIQETIRATESHIKELEKKLGRLISNHEFEYNEKS